jgi:hypothetical protein
MAATLALAVPTLQQLGPKLLTPQFLGAVAGLLNKPLSTEAKVVAQDGDFMELLASEVKNYKLIAGALFHESIPANLVPILLKVDAKVVHDDIQGSISAAHSAIVRKITEIGFSITQQSYTNAQRVNAYQGVDYIAAKVLVGIAKAKCATPDTNPSGLHNLLGSSAEEKNERTISFKTYDGQLTPAGYQVTIRLCRGVYTNRQDRVLWFTSTNETSSMEMSKVVYVIPTAAVEAFNEKKEVKSILAALDF